MRSLACLPARHILALVLGLWRRVNSSESTASLTSSFHSGHSATATGPRRQDSHVGCGHCKSWDDEQRRRRAALNVFRGWRWYAHEGQVFRTKVEDTESHTDNSITFSANTPTDHASLSSQANINTRCLLGPRSLRASLHSRACSRKERSIENAPANIATVDL